MNENNKTINLKIDKTTYKKLKIICAINETNITQYIRNLIISDVNNNTDLKKLYND